MSLRRIIPVAALLAMTLIAGVRFHQKPTIEAARPQVSGWGERSGRSTGPSAPMATEPRIDAASTPLDDVRVAPQGFPSGSLLRIASASEDLTELEGALSYKGRDYIMTADRSGVCAALLTRSPRETSPILTLRLQELRVGETRLPISSDVLPGREDAHATLSFNRGSVLERIQCGRNDFEQDFVISELPAGRGAMTVVERIATPLSPPAEGTRGAALRFGTRESGAFEISHAIAIDARGQKLPLDLTFAKGCLEMTVPAWWVESASLPIVIDPIVGSPFGIAGSLSFQGDARTVIAYGSGPNEWLVVWYDRVSSLSYQIYAQRVSATGALSGPQITLSTVTTVNYNPAVAYSAGLNQYLVLWARTDSNSNDHLIGRFLTATGTTPGPEIDLGTFPQFLLNLSMATDGVSTFYAVAENQSPSKALVGVLISNTGSILALSSPETNGSGGPTRPKVAYSNQEYLVSWSEGSTFLTRGMNTSGSFLTPITTVATNISPTNTAASAGSSQFLVSWSDSSVTTLWGRVAQAGTGGTINFTTAAFAISTSSNFVGAPHSCYSSTAGEWFVAHQLGTGSTIGTAADLVTASGSSTGDLAIASSPAMYPRTAWNSATHDVLVVYETGPDLSIVLTGQRFNLSSTLAAPTNLVATGGNTTVGLTWTGVTGATSYKIFQSTTSGTFSSTPRATVTGTAYTDTGLTNGTTYYYIVVASSPSGDSAASTQASATPLFPPPPAPTGVVATGLDGQIQIMWTAVPGATNYVVERGPAPGGPYLDFDPPINTTSTSILDTNVINGASYYYRVAAGNATTMGSWSAEASAVPRTPSTLLTVLFVANSTTLGAADTVLKTRLQDAGYTVVVKAAGGTAPVQTADATGKALVVISSTVNSSDVNTKFRTVAVPVLTWENGEYRQSYMSMTGPTANTDYGTVAGQTQITITNPTHPMAGGISGTVNVVATGSPAQTLAWGRPNANAVSIARVTADTGTNPRVVIFGYDKGALLPVPTGSPAFPAPARRVGFFLTDTTASTWTAQAGSLFDAAIQWATGALAAPVSISVTRAGASFKISWAPVEGATSYVLLRSTLPAGPFVAVQTGITGFDVADSPGRGTFYYSIESVTDVGAISGASPVASGVNLVGGYYNMAITGSRYIHALRSGATPDASNTATFNAIVYQHMDDGTTIGQVTTGITGSWTLTERGLGNHAPVSFTQSGTQCVVTASTPEAQYDDYSLYYLTFTGSVGGQAIVEKANFAVTQRRILAVVFRFPEDSGGGRGRSQRPGSDPWYSTDSNTRFDSRGAFAKTFMNQTVPFLQQAGINLYYGLDPDTLKINGFNPSTGDFIAADASGEKTLSWDELSAQNITTWINVYFMQSIKSGSSPTSTAAGITDTVWIPGSGFTDYIAEDLLLADSATPQVFAHELNHALGNPDVMGWDDISGDINNLKDISGDIETTFGTLSSTTVNPLNWNLMRWGILGNRSDEFGRLLAPNQSRKSYNNAGFNHPAFRGTD